MTREALPEAEERKGPEPLRILIADDHQDSREVLAAFLQLEGYCVCQAGDGEAALALACRFHPHVALLDLWMPRMNGIEACLKMRTGSCSPRLIWAITADWSYGDTMECFDGILHKPIDLATLTHLLAKSRQQWGPTTHANL
jgi:CheY-like chemotaxis protein